MKQDMVCNVPQMYIQLDNSHGLMLVTKRSAWPSVVAVSVACAIFNVFVFGMGVYLKDNHSSSSLRSQSYLPRPNQYIGLDRVNRTALHAAPPRPFKNYPPILTQLSKTREDYVFALHAAPSFVASAGTITSDERQVFLDNEVTDHAL